MKIIFISNFLTHHQLPFCLEMVERYGDDFKFISTIKITILFLLIIIQITMQQIIIITQFP